MVQKSTLPNRTTTSLMKSILQKNSHDDYASRTMLFTGSLLVDIEADVEVGCKDHGRSNSGTVISQVLYRLSVPRDRRPKRPNEIWHE